MCSGLSRDSSRTTRCVTTRHRPLFATAFLSPLLTCPSHLVQNKQTQESTIGAAFLTKTVPEFKVKFEIWDTAGQERYASLAPLYYRGASAAAIVYDITSKESFAKAKHWVKELQKNASQEIVIVLVGNKSDLEQDRDVSAEEAKAYAEENGMEHVEASAKTAHNVSEIFESIAAHLPRMLNQGEPK